jgi:hypothetical protein
MNKAETEQAGTKKTNKQTNNKRKGTTNNKRKNEQTNLHDRIQFVMQIIQTSISSTYLNLMIPQPLVCYFPHVLVCLCVLQPKQNVNMKRDIPHKVRKMRKIS